MLEIPKHKWWAPSIDRWHNQTGIAHVVYDGGALCGSKPFSTGGSFATPEQAGCKACQRCVKILNRLDGSPVHRVITYGAPECP